MIATRRSTLWAVTAAEFEQIALAALRELPPWAVEALANVVVLFEEEDAAEPDIYGIYDGVALPDRDGGEPVEPARIHLYRAPLVADFGHDPAELAEEIRVTVLHEIAHHFGIDDDRLEELGYG
jgi:predicted Zn-dependent protease with MMP-like domain